MRFESTTVVRQYNVFNCGHYTFRRRCGETASHRTADLKTNVSHSKNHCFAIDFCTIIVRLARIARIDNGLVMLWTRSRPPALYHAVSALLWIRRIQIEPNDRTKISTDRVNRCCFIRDSRRDKIDPIKICKNVFDVKPFYPSPNNGRRGRRDFERSLWNAWRWSITRNERI